MVLDNRFKVRVATITINSIRVIDPKLSELNAVVDNIKSEVEESIKHEFDEKKTDIDKLEEGFVDNLVLMRIDKYSGKDSGYCAYPETPWQDELERRMSDKLNEIRDYYKRNKRD